MGRHFVIIPTIAMALAATIALAPCAQAEEIGFPSRTLGDLGEVCSGGKIPADRAAALNFCHGYAQGVMSDTLRQAGEKPFCLPEHPPTRSATLAEFVTWAKAQPDKSKPAAESLVAFFKQRFPCNK